MTTMAVIKVIYALYLRPISDKAIGIRSQRWLRKGPINDLIGAAALFH